MGKINIWHLFALRSTKITGILVLFLLAGPALKAQFNAYSFDMKYFNKPLHFGILLGYNTSHFKVSQNEKFLYDDTISAVHSTRGPGFTLGIVSNLRLNKNFDIRLLPAMSFSERNLTYDTWHGEKVSQTIESINLEVPLLIKFKSDPYKDMRMYVIGGGKYAYDLASNAQVRNADDIVKIGRHDLQIELGAGLEIYFPMFILAPEIKISHGVFDIHTLDPNLQYSNIFDKLRTRTIYVTFNFEG